jgi:hypothetical protein
MAMDAEWEINQLKANLLKTQRFIAIDTMTNSANTLLTKLALVKNSALDDVSRRLGIELTTESSKLPTSEDPLGIASAFQEKCSAKAKELGLTNLNDPL